MVTTMPQPRLTLDLPTRLVLLVLAAMLVLSVGSMPQQAGSVALPTLPNVPSPAAMPQLARMGQLPLAFTPAASQAGVAQAYYVHTHGPTLAFTPAGIQIALPQRRPETNPMLPAMGVATAPRTEITAVQLAFLQPNAAVTIGGAERLPGVANYLVGDDPARWRRDVPLYADLIYHALYRGIDLRYDGAGGVLKGTYTVAPGADPSQIRWWYQGADAVQVDAASGDLQISVGDQLLTERAPLAWQVIAGRQQMVAARYTLARDGSIGFVLGQYDHAHALTIDPTLEFSTFLGNAAFNTGRGIAVDVLGDIYVTGTTFAGDVAAGSVPLPFTRGGEAFVARYSADGQTLRSISFVGGSDDDSGSGIGLDAQGNIYLGGTTSSADFPHPNRAQSDFHGVADAFVAKLNADASALLYTTLIGGSSSEESGGLAVDAQGNAVVVGKIFSGDWATTNAFQPTLGGVDCGDFPEYSRCSDAFVARLDAQGAIIFSTYLGGSHYEFGEAIATDQQGYVYATGSTASGAPGTTPFPLVNALDRSFGGGTCAAAGRGFDCADVFVTKFSPDGTVLYSTYLGGGSHDLGLGIATDQRGNSYATGQTISSPFTEPESRPLPAGSLRGKGYDAFLSKLAPDGQALEYSVTLGGSGFNDGGNAIAVDHLGNVYLAGTTDSNDFPLQDAPFQQFTTEDCGTPTRFDPCPDAFVAKVNPQGDTLRFSTYLGGRRSDASHGIATDSLGNVYVVGETVSNNFPTENAHNGSYGGGGGDAFVAKLFLADRYVALSGSDSGNDCSNASSPCRTIAAALTNAADGDIISIAAGTYNEPEPVRLTRRVALIGAGAGAGGTTINGNITPDAGAISVAPGTTAVVAGLRLRRGIATPGGGIANQGDLLVANSLITNNTGGSNGGGGIYNADGATIRVQNSTIANNEASANRGGGLYNALGSSATIIGTTISDNTATTSGGGVYNNGTMTIIDSTIAGNRAQVGAGIANATDSAIDIQSSTITNNAAQDKGGGIRNDSNGTITLIDSTITTNTAMIGGGVSSSGTLNMAGGLISANQLESPQGDGVWGSLANEWGGGISSEIGSTLTLSGTLISLNRVRGNPQQSNGGGVYLNQATAIITNTTISANEVFGFGGGIYATSSNLTVIGSTISANHARFANLPGNASCIPNPSGPPGCQYNEGGGIHINNSGTVTLINSTISGNRSDNIAGGAMWHDSEQQITLDYVTITDNVARQGGGTWNNEQASVRVRGSIIAGNRVADDQSPVGDFRPDCVGGLNSDGHNLFGNTSGPAECNPISSDILTDTAHLDLAPLDDNGGPTLTHALLPNSPALDRVPAGACPASDQRGAARPYPQGGACDIGAFEARIEDLHSGLDLVADTWRFPNPASEALTYDDYYRTFGEPTVTRIVTTTDTIPITATGEFDLPFTLDREQIQATLPISISIPSGDPRAAIPDLNAQLFERTVVQAIYDDANVEWVGSTLQPGLCVGMTSTVAGFHTANVPELKPQEFGASSVHNIALSSSVQSLLQRYHMRQASAEVLKYLADEGRHTDVKDYFDQLAARIATTEWKSSAEIIGLVKNEGRANQSCADASAGHALLPYRVARDETQALYRIYVYDPNFPAEPLSNTLDRYIEIVPAGAGWEWRYVIDRGDAGRAAVMWSGTALYSLPFTIIQQGTTLPTESDQGILLVNGAQDTAWGGRKGAWGGRKGAWGELGKGQQIGCAIQPDGSSVFTRTITGSLRLLWMHTPVLYIPTSAVEQSGALTFTSAGGEVSDMLIFGKDTTIGYLGTATDQTVDRLTVDPDLLTTTLRTTDQRDTKQITLYQMHEGNPDSTGVSETRVVAVSNVTLGSGDTLTMQTTLDANKNVASVTLINDSGTPTRADVGFASSGGAGVQSIIYQQQVLLPGNTYTYTPTVWQDLAEAPVIVTVNEEPPTTLTPQPIPASKLLDGFARRNGRLGAPWSGQASEANYRIIDRRVRVGTGGALYWAEQPFGVAQEAFMTLTDLRHHQSQVSLLLKVQGSTPNTSNGAIEVRYDRARRQLEILARGPGQARRTLTRFTVTYRDGDLFGARAFADGTVGVYQNRRLVGAAQAGSFFANRGGWIGLRYTGATGARFDDFGGGTLP